MINMIKFLFRVLILLAIFGIGLGFFLTLYVEKSGNQALFKMGKLPSPSPDGFYKGSFSNYTLSWLGKKFDKTDSTGINVFLDSNGIKYERYSFVTSQGYGARDKNVNLLKIDYNVPGNPFWLKPLHDELVSIEDGSYLGKIELRIIPGFPFTLGFFTLTRP
jgi:hypothetical protein